MTSEGKSAREPITETMQRAGDFILKHSAAEDVPAWPGTMRCKCGAEFTADSLLYMQHLFVNHIVTELLIKQERESRLSIAAALEMARETVRKVGNSPRGFSFMESIQAIDAITDADVAHTRAEHNRAVREPLTEALRSCIKDIEKFQEQLKSTTGGAGGHGRSVPYSGGLLRARSALASVAEAQPDVLCGQPERDIKRVLELCTDTSLVYYGPYPCPDCGKPICRLAEAQGGERFDYPAGPIYPNVNWTMHNCPITQCPRCSGASQVDSRCEVKRSLRAVMWYCVGAGMWTNDARVTWSMVVLALFFAFVAWLGPDDL